MVQPGSNSGRRAPSKGPSWSETELTYGAHVLSFIPFFKRFFFFFFLTNQTASNCDHFDSGYLLMEAQHNVPCPPLRRSSGGIYSSSEKLHLFPIINTWDNGGSRPQPERWSFPPVVPSSFPLTFTKPARPQKPPSAPRCDAHPGTVSGDGPRRGQLAGEERDAYCHVCRACWKKCSRFWKTRLTGTI